VPSSRLLLAAAFLAVLANLPVVKTPFFGDDHAILQVLEGVHPSALAARNRLDLFRFFPSDPDETRQRMAVGALPWRTQTDQQVAHFRPLSSALLWLDHTLFDATPLAPHVHNLLWLLLLVWSVGLLYRRVLGGTPGAVALLLFAICPFAVMTVGWWCCRPHTVAAALGMLGLLAHLRWREECWRAGLPLSLVLLSLALLAGEAGLQIIALLLAYATLGDGSSLRARLASILPIGAIVAGYFLLRATLGFGAWNNAYYADPVGEWRRFLLSVVVHIPDVLIQMLTTVSEKHWRAFAGFGGALPAAAVGTGLLLVRFRTLGTAMEPDQLRGLRWLLVGAGISLLPCFASLNFVRPWTLLIPAVGLAAAMGAVLVHIWDIMRARQPVTASTRAAYAPIGVLIVLAWVVAPVIQSLLLPGRFVRPRIQESLVYEALASFEPTADTVVVVRSPSDAYAAARALFGDHDHGGRRIRSAWILSDGAKLPTGLKVRRIAPQAIALVVGDNSLIPENDFFRGRHRPFKSGEEVDLGALRVRIVNTKGAAVRQAEYWFDRPLDDASLAFVYVDGTKVRALQLPPVGSSVQLPAGL
jgi:hypothetical protein